MVALAIAVGKRACANRVIGKESVRNKIGGMTSRNLEKERVRHRDPRTQVPQTYLSMGM
jgi:hypothetical protein